MICRSLCFLGLVAVSFSVFAVDFQCPKKIVTSQKLVNQAAGWSEFMRPNGDGTVDNWAYVSGISLYSGDPNQIAELKPDDENSQLPYWTFGEPAKAEEPLYMSCFYHGTRIEFTKKLPLNVRKCTAHRDGVLRCEVFKR